jgi:hypothetical protein
MLDNGRLRPLFRRALIRAVLVCGVSALLISWAAMPAAADPGDEGGSPALAKALEAANRGFLDSLQALEASKKRQIELGAELTEVQSRLPALEQQANEIAMTSYRIGNLSALQAVLNSNSPEGMIDRATTLHVLANRNDERLREVKRLRDRAAAAKAGIDVEVANQQRHADAMMVRKREVEKALASVGGGATSGYSNANAPLARPAPRRADGSWPAERCVLDDPTTNGCLTARTLHALQQAKAAGFTRYVACHRPGGPYEHPKGRACDFAAQPNGFGGVATGGDRAYGNNLAAFFVRNANRLGVLYVIWFEQIWTPSTGWRAYRSGRGDPSSDHTNHTHVSMY